MGHPPGAGAAPPAPGLVRRAAATISRSTRRARAPRTSVAFARGRQRGHGGAAPGDRPGRELGGHAHRAAVRMVAQRADRRNGRRRRLWPWPTCCAASPWRCWPASESQRMSTDCTELAAVPIRSIRRASLQSRCSIESMAELSGVGAERRAVDLQLGMTRSGDDAAARGWWSVEVPSAPPRSRLRVRRRRRTAAARSALAVAARRRARPIPPRRPRGLRVDATPAGSRPHCAAA